MPQGWEALESTDTQVTFSGASGQCYFQLKTYPAARFASAEDIAVFTANELRADAEGEPFSYLGEDAMFFSFLFAMNNQPYDGFGLTINGADYDWIIISFAASPVYERFTPFLLSSLDSFSLDDRGLLSPGPVSRYYQESYGEEEFVNVSVPFRQTRLSMELEKFAMESSTLVVEREAVVLNNYTPEDADAWSRFYRMIYRDTYRKMDPLYRAMIFEGLRPGGEPAALAGELLAFVQNFEYDRTWNLADFAAPQEVLISGTGDCDSLAILYVILLKHYGVEGILMVSSRYSHALAAADVTGPGARFPFEGTNYLVAETTAPVSLGQIEASMSNVEGWLGIGFFP
jgi:hypothetical protein